MRLRPVYTPIRAFWAIAGLILVLGLSAAPSASATVPGPVGPAGTWVNTFDDEFSGMAVDLTKWQPHWYSEGGTMNKAPTYAKNVTVSNGALKLNLASSSSGALVHTDFPGGYRFPVGSYVEARIYFPGPSATSLSNWSAFWTTSTQADGWASSGEHDIAEILGGTLTKNYHYGLWPNDKSVNMGGVSGFAPGNSWHTYGLYRGTTSATVYWDGKPVQTYATHDNGKPEIVVLNVGNGSNSRYGVANAMQADYVRAWKPAA